MRKLLALAALAVAVMSISSEPAEARRHRHRAPVVSCQPWDWGCGWQQPAQEARSRRWGRRAARHERRVRHRWSLAGTVIGGRPAGCPRAFCGCGTSIEHFGRIIPGLNLARAWFKFPRATPAPDMVAVRRHHVFTLKRHVAGDRWIVKDYNSGGGRTRLHERSIAGHAIVNPRG